MTKQVPVGGDAVVRTRPVGNVEIVTDDIAYLRLMIVNAVFVGKSMGPWLLVDAGLPGMADTIARAASDRFGIGSKPAAIVLTHGHFDHAGSLPGLAEKWDVPIFAHTLEIPYLNGTSSYPPPDPAVGGGMMSMTSGLIPRGPVDVSSWLQELPATGEIPGFPGWRWIHTPGHTPGHVSLWREKDRTLLSGDAVITTAQESVYAVLTQSAELHGPPMFYTIDWDAARESVRELAALDPEILVSGHGPPLQGSSLRKSLHHLAAEFDTYAMPRRGRYVQDPARADNGEAYQGVD